MTQIQIYLLSNNFVQGNSTFFENKASLYSLAFPLDEACPVAINVGSHIQILNNTNLRLVYSNENPSICMFYDSQTRQHSVYFIRKVTSNEKSEFANRMNSTCPSAASMSNKVRNDFDISFIIFQLQLKSRVSMWDCTKNPNYLPVPSPINSRPGSVGSFYHQIHHSKSQSSMATVRLKFRFFFCFVITIFCSRCQSPATSSLGSSWLQRASRLNASLPCGGNNSAPTNHSFFDNSKLMPYFHTTPIVCLDHVWTDPSVPQYYSFSQFSII